MSFFPFVNLLAIALMVSIAADDALVLLFFYRQHSKSSPGSFDF